MFLGEFWKFARATVSEVTARELTMRIETLVKDTLELKGFRVAGVGGMTRATSSATTRPGRVPARRGGKACATRSSSGGMQVQSHQGVRGNARLAARGHGTAAAADGHGGRRACLSGAACDGAVSAGGGARMDHRPPQSPAATAGFRSVVIGRVRFDASRASDASALPWATAQQPEAGADRGR